MIRRGKYTDAVFARAVHATSHFYSTDPRTGRAIERVETISPEQARELFVTYKRAKMRRRDETTFVFVVGTSIGYERIEIEVA